MKSTPIEVEKLGLVNVGYLAQKRLARGLRLNCTEAVALIATQAFVFMFVCWSLFVMVIIDSGRIDGSWETTPWKFGFYPLQETSSSSSFLPFG
ncbi:urease-like isoform X3 [Tripterygium wilfordii]|uniref:urease-like isoform X3 n=1 Tax=Tripterygium wilfordii TaxID=458696 RepID=UPI0018F8047E|nr:urease-like isoform X3 [Tripterygium wilfordii]